MRRFLGATASVLLLVVYLAPMAQSEPVESGQAVGAGWGVAADLGDPGTINVTLVPSADASVPVPCPPAPDPCEDHASDNLLTAQVLDGGVADASALISEAHAFKDPALSASPERLADLQALMGTLSGVTLPTEWNLRGYGAVSDLSIGIPLLGSITADLVEAEAVSGLRDVAGTPTPVTASGARVTNLEVLGTPIAILPGMGPNTELFNAADITITYWETNWDPATGTTTDGNPVYVNTLRIVSTIPGASFDIVVARAQATAVTYDAPNLPPDAVDDSRTTEQDTPILINVTANDSDPDGSIDNSTVAPTDPPNGSVSCTDNMCTYTPDPGFTGTDTFDYTVCDNDGACDTATVTVTVEAPDGSGGGGGGGNAPPNARNDSATTGENDPVVIDVTDNDTDSDGTIDDTTVAPTQPADGTVTCDDNMCTYTPDPGFSGTDTFDYTVCDNDGACDTATVTVTVTANLPPDAVDDSRTTDHNTPVVINVTGNDSDPDGTIDNSTVTPTDPPNGSVTCTDNMCTYTPDTGFTGVDTFDYTVCDDDGACDTATVTVTVNAADGSGGGGGGNNPPNARDDNATTPQGSLVVVDVTANDTDSDGTLDPTSITTTQPANGTVTCTLNLCTYTPDPGFTGTDTFDYTVCDNDGACDTATVTITVTPISTGGGGGSQPPNAVDDTATAQPGLPVTVPVTDNDTGNLDPSTVTIVTPPSDGTVDCANDGSCTYTPNDGFTGEDDFTYEVCNGSGQCDQAIVTIVVPDTSPPVAEDDGATTPRGTPVPITVIQNDSDPDGDLDTSSVRVIQQPANGSVTCLGGICTYTPDPGYTGEDSFVYEVCDAEGNCDTATVTIDVHPPTTGGDGPGGSVGEGGNPGGPAGPDGSPDGPGGPDRDGQPSRPDRFSPAPDGPAPEAGLNPTLGAPNPLMPLTGAEPGFYLALAWNLVLVGGLLLFLDARTRRAAAVNVPATLAGGTDLLERTEVPADATLPEIESQSVPEPEPETIEPPVATDEPKPKKAAARKPAAKKPAPKKATAITKPTARKSPAKKATSKKSTVARKTSTVKKSTVAKRPTSAKKSTVTKKVSSTKKSTVAKKAPARSTSTKKSTVKRSSVRE